MLSTADAKTLIRNLELNRVVLFAGAGFSVDAENTFHESLPLASELAKYLWSF